MKEKASKAPLPTPSSEPVQDPAVPTNSPRLTPGMATLLRGSGGPKTETKDQPPANGQPSAPPTTPASRSRAVQISLIVADALLLALAARIVLKSNGHLGFIESALCVVALGLGAWLSCLALWRD